MSDLPKMDVLAKIKPIEVGSLENIGDTYVISLYDKLAKEASQLMYIRSLDLIPRVLKNSTQGLDPFEIDVYLLGVFNTHSLQLKPLNCMLDYDDAKSKIKRGLDIETR